MRIIFLFLVLSGFSCNAQDFQYTIKFNADSLCTYENSVVHFTVQIKNIGDEPLLLPKYRVLTSFRYSVVIEKEEHISYYIGALINRGRSQTIKDYITLEKNTIYEISDSIDFRKICVLNKQDSIFPLFCNNNSHFGYYNIKIKLTDDNSKVQKRLKYFETPIIRVRYKEE